MKPFILSFFFLKVLLTKFWMFKLIVYLCSEVFQNTFKVITLHSCKWWGPVSLIRDFPLGVSKAGCQTIVVFHMPTGNVDVDDSVSSLHLCLTPIESIQLLSKSLNKGYGLSQFSHRTWLQIHRDMKTLTMYVWHKWCWILRIT